MLTSTHVCGIIWSHAFIYITIPACKHSLSGGAHEMEMLKWNFGLQNTLSNVCKFQYWIKIPDEIKLRMAAASRLMWSKKHHIADTKQSCLCCLRNITEIFTADERCWQGCSPYLQLDDCQADSYNWLLDSIQVVVKPKVFCRMVIKGWVRFTFDTCTSTWNLVLIPSGTCLLVLYLF